MIDSLAPIYRRLPSPARAVAASARGLYLRRWRYGRETEPEIDAALERDSWSAARWSEWQEGRLAALLGRAASSVPFYREWWNDARRKGRTGSPDRLEDWPVVTKSQVRANPLAFIAEDRDPSKMFHNRTGGSTGTPLDVFSTRRTLRRHYALFEARVRRWHGVSRRDPWALLGGQVVVAASRTRPPFWVFNAASNQLYLSSFHLSPANAAAYARALWRHSPTHLITFASSGAVLASACIAAGILLPEPEAIFSNAETLLEPQRGLLAKAFGCPVRNTYGMVEMAAAASECRHGSLHVWPDEGLLEVLDDGADTPVRPGQAGRFVATGLVNEDMPLIRYDTGDRGAVCASSCGCGRALPVLERVEGRSQDMIRTPDGRKVWYFNPALYGLPIAQSQIVQEALDSVRVRVVPAEAFLPRHAEELRRRILVRLGSVPRVEIETVPELPRTAGGKVRPVVSLLPAADA